MFHTRGLLGLSALAMTSLVCAGCDKDTQVPKVPAPAQTTQPVAVIVPAVVTPATTAAAKIPAAPVLPVETFMSIAQEGLPPQMVSFPPAKLRLKKTEAGTLQAVLYTDDPPAASSGDYKGNSYLFEMELPDITDPADIGKAQFRYRADGGSVAIERDVESTNGVFLNGWDTHLQPTDTAVVFEGQPPQLMAKVVGRFKVVNEEKDGPARNAMVQAILPVMVEKDVEKKK